MEKIGEVAHFFTNINVGVIELDKPLKKGDKIKIKGSTTDFEQEVESMEVDGDKIDEAKKGDSIGMKVKKRVREGDLVYKV